MSIRFSKSGGAMVMTKHRNSWITNIQNHAQQVMDSVAQLLNTASEKREQTALNHYRAEQMINQCRCSPAQTEFSIYSNRIIK